MPYFRWKGIDWFGSIHKGYQFSKSENDLEKILLSQGIGLISSKIENQKFYSRSINLTEKVQFFKELSILVDSGILIHNALEITSKQIKNRKLNRVIQEIQFDIVQKGESFANSIEKHSDSFDQLIIQLIHAGQESDKLGESLASLSNYLEEKEKFVKKLNTILFLPAITFSFFLVITFIIFTAIIPAFFSIFSNFGQQIPKVTNILFKISFFIKSNKFYALIISIFTMILMLIKYSRGSKDKILLDKLIIKIPFIGLIMIYSNLTFFLQSLSLLLEGGVHLVNAINLSSKSIKNSYLKTSFLKLYDSVSKGGLLSCAMYENRDEIFEPDLIAMIRVGEESGKMNLLLKKSADLYFSKSNRMLSFFLAVIQPILMLILGILIASLIFAIYLPIFNLPNMINI